MARVLRLLRKSSLPFDGLIVILSGPFVEIVCDWFQSGASAAEVSLFGVHRVLRGALLAF
jgi:hypothetical protein